MFPQRKINKKIEMEGLINGFEQGGLAHLS